MTELWREIVRKYSVTPPLPTPPPPPEKKKKHKTWFSPSLPPEIDHGHLSFIEFESIYRSYRSGKWTSIRAYPLDPRVYVLEVAKLVEENWEAAVPHWVSGSTCKLAVWNLATGGFLWALDGVPLHKTFHYHLSSGSTLSPLHLLHMVEIKTASHPAIVLK